MHFSTVNWTLLSSEKLQNFQLTRKLPSKLFALCSLSLLSTWPLKNPIFEEPPCKMIIAFVGIRRATLHLPTAVASPVVWRSEDKVCCSNEAKQPMILDNTCCHRKSPALCMVARRVWLLQPQSSPPIRPGIRQHPQNGRCS